MLSFIVVSSTVRKDTNRSVKSVVGGQERFDVLARCLLNLDRWKERIQYDLNLTIFLSHPEEQTVLNIPLQMIPSTLGGELDSVYTLIELFSNPDRFNVEVTNINFENLMLNLSKNHEIYYLTPDGGAIEELAKNFVLDSNYCFVLGSQYDLSEAQEQVLLNIKMIPISLGDKEYLASHVITTICYQFLS